MSDVFVQIASGYKVTERTVTLVANTVQQVCKADPNRWELIFSSIGAQVVLSTATPSAQVGISLDGSVVRLLRFNMREDAALAQVAWNAFSTLNPTFTIIEVTNVQ